ncbi:MAG TPA: TetR family transcriptional regulator [Burkholderiaceae bacterium]|nr:TetR family transcriptional regulator [Burkholderiaceae bacterium]
MARRTKEEALATRSHILDTAERVFEERGVSGTSLNEIANAAGLTRGAIYWHFENKADLFNAMMDRATLPLEQIDVASFKDPDTTPAQICAGFVDIMHRVVHDPQLRRVFDIATHKVEYVGEMDVVRIRHLEWRNECIGDIERAFKRAKRNGMLPASSTPRSAALGLVSLFDGLLMSWMLERGGFDLPRTGAQAFEIYLAGLSHAGAAHAAA